MELFFDQYFNDKQSNYSVVIEENDKVCYAYLLEGENIVSDVWLYNLVPYRTNSWDDISEEDLPLQNLERHIIDDSLKKINNENDVVVSWDSKEDYVSASIFIQDKLIALLYSNEKIGYSTNVTENLPIAKKLDK